MVDLGAPAELVDDVWEGRDQALVVFLTQFRDRTVTSALHSGRPHSVVHYPNLPEMSTWIQETDRMLVAVEIVHKDLTFPIDQEVQEVGLRAFGDDLIFWLGKSVVESVDQDRGQTVLALKHIVHSDDGIVDAGTDLLLQRRTDELLEGLIFLLLTQTALSGSDVVQDLVGQLLGQLHIVHSGQSPVKYLLELSLSAIQIGHEHSHLSEQHGRDQRPDDEEHRRHKGLDFILRPDLTTGEEPDGVVEACKILGPYRRVVEVSDALVEVGHRNPLLFVLDE